MIIRDLDLLRAENEVVFDAASHLTLSIPVKLTDSSGVAFAARVAFQRDPKDFLLPPRMHFMFPVMLRNLTELPLQFKCDEEFVLTASPGETVAPSKEIQRFSMSHEGFIQL